MVINCSLIEQKLKADFRKKYRRFSNFVDSGHLWDRIIEITKDAELMRNIKFCNDVLKIPPVKIFVLVQKSNLPLMSNEEKQFIGAAFGFVFKFVLGYTNQKRISCTVNSVKSASFFYFDNSNMAETIKIID